MKKISIFKVIQFFLDYITQINQYKEFKYLIGNIYFLSLCVSPQHAQNSQTILNKIIKYLN